MGEEGQGGRNGGHNGGHSSSEPNPPFFNHFPFSAEHERPQATRTGMFVAVGAGLGVSYTLLRHGQTLLQLFLSGNGSGW